MTRAEFIKMCGLLGIGMPLTSSMASCNNEVINPDFDGKVIIIGAGAAGLAAGYLLQQQNIAFEILEASSLYGGRMRTNNDFVDFPIPLGAEWLHVETGVFAEIVNNNSVQVDVPTKGYDSAVDYGLLNGQRLTPEQVGFTIDRKFINGTWFDFFEQYIAPSVQDKIRYNKVVTSIDYSGDKVQVATQNETFEADRIIVSVPVKILQNGTISFSPSLPNAKQNAIDKATVWSGFKAFIEFSEKFYPTFIAFETTPETAGQKLYYDASYGQNTNRHVLGLFSVGVDAETYIPLSDQELKDFMLNELDAIFDNKASASYIKHLSQNWNAEPYANGAYVVDHEDWRRVRTLGESVDDKIYFAGDAYTEGEDWSSVHTAARSAKAAVDELVS